jgi:hypothetical protein
LPYLRPDLDSSVGSWADEGGATSNLYQSIDEETPNDTDYVQSEPNPSNSKYKVRLSNPGTAVNTDEPVTVRYRYRKSGAATTDITVTLVQGASTVIASNSHAGVTTTVTAGSFVLSTGEKAAVTDWDDLFLEFEGDVAGGGGGTPPTVFALSPIYLNAGSGTIAWPAGHAVDDIAILHLCNKGNDAGPTLPAGWTAFAAHPNGPGAVSSNYPIQSLFWRRATSTSETAAAISDGGQRTYGRMIVVRGCVTTGTPFDEGTAYGAIGSAESTTTTPSIPAVTSSVNDCLILALYECVGGLDPGLISGFTNANLTSVTNLHEDHSTAGGGYSTYAASGVLTTAGSSGATTAEFTELRRHASIQIAMKPA